VAKELVIRITGDQSGLQKATDDSIGTLKGFGSKVSALSVAAGNLLADGIKTGFRAAGGFLKDSIGAASDMSETVSKVNVLFGDAAGQITTFASTAALGLGQSKQQAMDAAATFATFGKSAGLTGTPLAKFSTDLVGLSSDLASFSNTSPEDAIQAIGSALRGEAEPMRRYGVLLDDTSMRQEALAMGIISSTKNALTPQQKVLAAQSLIFKQTGAAQGDFARTSDGLANKQRILSAQFTNLKEAMGTAFLPSVLSVATTLSTKLMPILEKFGPIISQEIAGGITAFVASFKAADGDITSSGFPGFMERLGFAASIAWDLITQIAGGVAIVVTAFQTGTGPFEGFSGTLSTLGVDARYAWEGIKLAGGWIMDNWSQINQLLLIFGPAAAGAFGAFRTVGAVNNAVTAVKGLGVAFKVLNIAMLANPIGLWVAAIAAVGIGLYMAYKHSETFRNAVNTVARAIKGAWDTVVGVFRSGAIGDAFAKVWDGVQNGLGKLWALMQQGLNAVGNWITGTALPWIGEKAGQLATVIVKKIPELASAFGDWVATGTKTLIDKLPGWLGALTEWIVGTALPWLIIEGNKLAFGLVGWVVGAAADLVVNLVVWLAKFEWWLLSEAYPWLIVKGAELAVKLAGWVLDSAEYLADNLPAWLAKFAVWIVTDALPAMYNFGRSASEKVGDAFIVALKWMVTDAIPKLASFGLDASVAIYNAFSGAMNWMGDIALEIITGLIRGLGDLGWKLAAAVGDLVRDKIVGPIKDALHISSPSKVTAKLGMGVAEGLMVGMDRGRAMVSGASGRLAFAAVPSVGMGGFTPAQLPGAGGGWSASPIVVQTYLDGRQIATSLAPHSRNLERSKR